jgi:hypothetical protein
MFINFNIKNINLLVDTGGSGWEPYEQNEPLTIRIKNIIEVIFFFNFIILMIGLVRILKF